MIPENVTFARRIPELDGLRGLAILLILLLHYFIEPARIGAGPTLKRILALGELAWSGVDLFFVLSGFLIGGILLDARTSPMYFKTFYMRRFFRILPLYYIVFALYLIGSRLTISSGNPGLAWLFREPLSWVGYATFTQNFFMAYYGRYGAEALAPTWSLAIEEQFYLSLPLVIRYVPPTRLLYALLIPICAAPLFRFMIFYAFPQGALAAYVLVLCRADALLLGALGAVLVRRAQAWNYLVRHKNLLYGVLLVLATGVGIMAVRGYSTRSLVMISVGYTWLALFYLCLLLLALIKQNGVMHRVLRNPMLMSLGTIAYATYLLHHGINGLCHSLFSSRKPQLASVGDLLITLLALLATIVLAKLSWRYFEKPLVERGHSYKYQARRESPES